MISAIVYLLCALTSVLCAVLLINSYSKNQSRLLFWSGICFGCLALNNILLFIDVIILPTQFDLAVVRTVPAVIGFALLLWGFVWDTV
jgi:hypothetical protein